MRVGVGLPWSGPLSEPAATAATAAAAEQLGCATVWSSSVGQLLEVASASEALDLGFVWDEVLLPVAPRAAALQVLGRRLTHLVVPADVHECAGHDLPHVRVLDPDSHAPAPLPGTGWAPAHAPLAADLRRWRTDHPAAELVLRVAQPPDADELGRWRQLGVDELVLVASGSTSLDRQLADLAETAEGVAALAPRAASARRDR